jgi:HEPN/Toprim N-terminal domain 1
MGIDAELYFDNVQADWGINAELSVCRILFRPSDFQQVPLRKLPAHLRALHKRGYYFDSNPQAYSVLYGSAAAAERRLSILGYSRARVEEAWNSAKTEMLLNAEQDDDSSHEALSKMKRKIASQFDVISYKEWQTKYAEIQRAKANGRGDNSAETFIFLRSLDLTEIANDPLMWVAIQLYAFEPTELWADLTYLIESESETKESIFGEDEIPSRLSRAFGKITLLTEGITDSRILKASLNEFYPEARDLYSFVDFEGFKVEGGASPLARLLRGFAGAGLTDRYIAIFDNDAAGHEALASLKSIGLPSNIRTITLPDLEFARDYPTIGPTGKVNADINGAAVSIESFLGRDALIRDGQLRPVRWSQWNSKAERYQGEIEGKSEVSARYLVAIKEIKNPEVLPRKFADMDALLCTIFGVFA